MRRHTLAAALLLTAAFAAPAAANPIAFVSGPSPVAIVSGILTVNGPEVAGQFVLETTNGAMFTGNWPGFTERSVAGAVGTGFFAPAATPAPGRGSSTSAPARPAAPAAPAQLVGQLFGFQPTPENAQAVFVTAVIIALVPNLGPVIQGPIGVLAPSDQVNGLDGFNGANVPEPGTIILLSSGLAGLAVARRRRKKA